MYQSSDEIIYCEPSKRCKRANNTLRDRRVLKGVHVGLFEG